MTSHAEDWIPTRQSLLSRLRNWDDRASWEDFFNTYWRLIYRVALKSGLTATEAEEVVQETIINVAKNIPKFEYDPQKGSFKGWLLKTTQWRISDQFRRRKRQVPLDLQEPAGSDHGLKPDLASEIPPEALRIEAEWDDAWRENLLETALERIKHKADPREFQIFDLAVRREMPVAKVAAKLNVTSAHVYYAKYKIARILKKELARLEKGKP